MVVAAKSMAQIVQRTFPIFVPVNPRPLNAPEFRLAHALSPYSLYAFFTNP
jgi:hypothetical protein